MFWLLARFRVRVRAAALSAQALASYSELRPHRQFHRRRQRLAQPRLVVIAGHRYRAVVVASSMFNAHRRALPGWRHWLQRCERSERLAGDESRT